MSDIFLTQRHGKRPRRAPSSRYAKIVPLGINVLVVDSNEVSLAITEAKLCQFGYTVFTARGVLEGELIVEDVSTNIHLVLAEARSPGTEKFEILDKLGRRPDVAVVILTDEDDKDTMVEALKRGAFFYLVKPIPTVIVTKLWQFALVKKREGCTAGLEEKRGELKEKDGKTQGSSGASKKEGRKRKIEKENEEGDGDYPTAKEKRPKLAWTLELHERFLQAMEVLGSDRAHPKGILQQMGIPGLRKEHISSHLQKYRIYLKNMEKLAAEKSSMSLAASGIVSSCHPSSSLAVAGGEAEVIPMSLDVSSSWTVTPMIRGVSPCLVQSSSKPGTIGPSMAYPGLPKRFDNHPFQRMESLRNKPSSYNPPICLGTTGKSHQTGYKQPASFSRDVWLKYNGESGLPGSVYSAVQEYGTQDKGCTTASSSTEEVEEKPCQWLP